MWGQEHKQFAKGFVIFEQEPFFKDQKPRYSKCCLQYLSYIFIMKLKSMEWFQHTQFCQSSSHPLPTTPNSAHWNFYTIVCSSICYSIFISNMLMQNYTVSQCREPQPVKSIELPEIQCGSHKNSYFAVLYMPQFRSCDCHSFRYIKKDKVRSGRGHDGPKRK